MAKEPDFIEQANPYVGLATSLGGLGLGIYGAYQQGQIQDQNYAMQQREYARQLQKEKDDLARELARQALSDKFSFAENANSNQDRLLAAYKPYYRQIGF